MLCYQYEFMTNQILQLANNFEIYITGVVSSSFFLNFCLFITPDSLLVRKGKLKGCMGIKIPSIFGNISSFLIMETCYLNKF